MPQPTEIPPISQEQMAEEAARQEAMKARWQYMLTQMNNLRVVVRGLHVNLFIAGMNDELDSQFKKDIKAQLMQMAANLDEVKQ